MFEEIKFNEHGLVPCVTQDAFTGEVLMLAYMNEESIKITLETGYATYFSRSRQELWVKGGTSDNFQQVISMRYDCDGDTILLKVKQLGAACHTGERTCFYKEITQEGVVDHAGKSGYAGFNALYEEYQTILDRKDNPVEGSYTNYLFDKGVEKICKKVGEEASEMIIAAMKGDGDELKCEIADFLYHASVLMATQGLLWEDVFGEIEKRLKK